MRFKASSSKANGPARWVTQWLVSGIGLALVSRWVDGVRLDAQGWEAVLTVLCAAAVLGLLNLLLKPLLLIITLPVNILTLGLFTLVINGFVLSAASRLVPSFHIAGFGTAIWAAFLLSLLSMALNAVSGGAELRIDIRRGGR